MQARYLHNLNRQRQALEEEVLKQARALIRQNGLEARPVLVLGKEGWHPGVIGIVAARLAEEYYRPVALVSLENGRGRGSARSIEGFHLFQGLHACRQVLHKYGGHAGRGGLRNGGGQPGRACKTSWSRPFSDTVGLRSRPGPPSRSTPRRRCQDLDRVFYRHLETLRPFGPGNPAPVIVCLEVECLGSRVVGGRHLKVQLAQGGNVLEAIAFDQAGCHPMGGTLDVALGTRVSYFQGRTTPDLRLLDWGRP